MEKKTIKKKDNKKTSPKNSTSKKKNEIDSSTEDDSPSWYHYLIVLGILALIIIGAYLIFEIFSKEEGPQGTAKKFVYKHKVGNITYNIEFNNPIDVIENSNIVIEPNKFDLLNSKELIFAIDEYNGTDNGYVAVSATKLANFFRVVYKFSYDVEENFKKFEDFNCENATEKNKVLTFDVNTNENAIYFKNNNCIELKSKTAPEMLLVSDALIYEMIK